MKVAVWWGRRAKYLDILENYQRYIAISPFFDSISLKE
jgi:hypothetical protein